ncbi:MAG: flap endonuclease-1 [Candidatus Diapherotrites archaeon]
MGTPIGDLVESEKIDLASLTNKTIAVDAHNILYQFLTSIRGPEGRPLMDAEGKITSHLAGLLYRTSSLIELGIKPIFVFDGLPHPLKKATLEKRHAIRTDAKEKMEKAIASGDFEKARMMGARAVSLNKEMIEEAKKAMEYLGLPFIEGAQEGEAQAAYLVQKKMAYAAGTQDYDALLFNTPIVIRNMAITGKRKLPYRNAYVNVEPEKVVLDSVLSELHITHKQLIWIAMLIGTDFNEKIPLVGPKKALKAVQGKKSFKEVVDGINQTVDYDWVEVEKLFTHPSVKEIKEIPFAQSNREKAIAFYCDTHGFDHVRVTNALNKIEKKPEDEKQSTLSKWG